MSSSVSYIVLSYGAIKESKGTYDHVSNGEQRSKRIISTSSTRPQRSQWTLRDLRLGDFYIELPDPIWESVELPHCSSSFIPLRYSTPDHSNGGAASFQLEV
ncbi:hypothetical protein Ancab_035681 [Ancistrocladus abbreviatus]